MLAAIEVDRMSITSGSTEIPKPMLSPNGTEKLYVYRWNRCGRKGQVCRVLARGTMNSCLLEFEDGWRMVTSRNALKRAQ
jgi:hypothetical protein